MPTNFEKTEHTITRSAWRSIAIVASAAALGSVLACCAPRAGVPAQNGIENYANRTFVYEPNNYAMRVVSVHPEGPEGPWLHLETFESTNPARRLDLPLSRVDLLREPVDEHRAHRLEELVVRGASVEGQGQFDLTLYILGTPEQAAIAVATIMDRIESGSDSHARTDLYILHSKLLGELASVRGVATDVAAYVRRLQEERRAVPKQERRLAVDPPEMLPAPLKILAREDLETPGWHVVHQFVTASEAWFLGDGTTDNGVLETQSTRPARKGEWFLSVHQDRHEDDYIWTDWVVLSHGDPATIRMSGDIPIAVVEGVDIPMVEIAQTNCETGVLTFFFSPPSSAGRALGLGPRGTVLIWPYGAAIEVESRGRFPVYATPTEAGPAVLATRNVGQ